MTDVLHYKNYQGSVQYSADDDCLYGRVLNIRSVIVYGGQSLDELKAMFEEAVDDYLASCTARNIAPETPRITARSRSAVAAARNARRLHRALAAV
nr:MAG TPA: putative nuclease [Caudoviricetes sp.]